MARTAATGAGSTRRRPRSPVAAPAAGGPPLPAVAPRKKPGVVARRVMPYVPVALGLLAQVNPTAPPSTPTTVAADFKAAVCAEDISGYEECHNEYPTGCSKAAGYDPYLNEFKNYVIQPALAPVSWFHSLAEVTKLDQQLPTTLARNNHAQVGDAIKKLGEGSVAGVIGYLYYAQKGGTSESSNCQLGGPDEIDFHIGLGFDANLAAKLAAKQKLTPEEKKALTQDSMIVEMTPHWRARFQPDWSLDLLKPAVGHQVKVVGQLLVDNEHYDGKDDCAYKGANPDTCWRASVWELHPVTGFEVCGSGDGCTPEGAGWVELTEFTAGAGAPPAAAAKKPQEGSTPPAGH